MACKLGLLKWTMTHPKAGPKPPHKDIELTFIFKSFHNLIFRACERWKHIDNSNTNSIHFNQTKLKRGDQVRAYSSPFPQAINYVRDGISLSTWTPFVQRLHGLPFFPSPLQLANTVGGKQNAVCQLDWFSCQSTLFFWLLVAWSVLLSGIHISMNCFWQLLL